MEIKELTETFDRFVKEERSFAIVGFDGMCAYVVRMENRKLWHVGFKMGSMDFAFISDGVKLNNNPDKGDAVSLSSTNPSLVPMGRILFDASAIICISDINNIEDM